MPDIGLWHRCSSDCVMCTNMDSFVRAPDRCYDAASQRRQLRRLAARSRSGAPEDGYVLFTGGEPTLHPDFLVLLEEYRSAFPSAPFTLLTNGRRMSQQTFTESLLSAGGRPLTVAVALHGPTARAHDAVTRSPGSFLQTLKGLRNLLGARRRGQELEIRLVLHRMTASSLGGTLRLLLRAFPKGSLARLCLIHFEVEGQAEKGFPELALSLSESVASLLPHLSLLERFPDFRLYHFPLCVLPPALHPRVWKSLPQRDIRFLRKCRPCRLRRECPGLQRWYPGRFGEDEIRCVR